jgi:hypothetical protein
MDELLNKNFEVILLVVVCNFSKTKQNSQTWTKFDASLNKSLCLISAMNTGRNLLCLSAALHAPMHWLNGNVAIPASNSIIAAFTARGAAIGPATPFTKQTVNYSKM